MSNTLRKVATAIKVYPNFLEHMREQVEPLEHELSIIRNINWELSKLPDDASVIRCVQFVMEHRGYGLGARNETE